MIREEKIATLNEAFALVLDAIPSAGYIWEPIFDDEYLTLVDSRFDPPPSSAIGGGSRQRFSFLPIKVGETTLTMRYKRPWETNVREEKKFVVIINEQS
jgi:predicted secreted protein